MFKHTHIYNTHTYIYITSSLVSQVTSAGSLITTIQDRVDTGAQGMHFLKLDSGMTSVLRPALYGAQHPLVVVPAKGTHGKSTQSTSAQTESFVVVGHCCETGDTLTVESGNAERVCPRTMATACVNDCCVIEAVGSYCASMNVSGYNSFPMAAAVLVRDTDCTPNDAAPFVVIERRQTLEQLMENETHIVL